jgi:hypothetical protein
MFAKLDIRKSALTMFAAAALSTVAGIASSVFASPLAASAHLAAQPIAQQAEYGTAQDNCRGHRLCRPANRFNGFVGTPDGRTTTLQAR